MEPSPLIAKWFLWSGLASFILGMHTQFLQIKAKLLEGELERTLKLTAFQTKAILIGNFYTQQPAKSGGWGGLILLLALGTLVRQGIGCTVALRSSAAWMSFWSKATKWEYWRHFGSSQVWWGERSFSLPWAFMARNCKGLAVMGDNAVAACNREPTACTESEL